MPLYLFKNPNTSESIEIFFKMNEKKIYIDKNNLEWIRQYTVPNASIDTTIDPYSKSDFIKVTNKSGCTLGDLWDRSSELSQRRAEKEGIDPISEKYKKEREDQTGVKPLNDDSKKKAAQERLKKLGVSVKEKKQSR